MQYTIEAKNTMEMLSQVIRSSSCIYVWVEGKVCSLIENIDYIDGRVGSNGTCGSLN